ncbi:MAG: BREX system Lon protease-like protein BrxL [Deltaproteobacteria bacterium]|nr:MAG: BREX system Lon protease-like protein BrxL [Deltaproteobacteria bacterium]
MRPFEAKARDYYGEVIINKGLMAKAGFGARAIPVYVGEWIISQFVDKDDLSEESRQEIVKIVTNYLPQKADKNIILNRLKEQEEVQILDDFRVNVNLEKNVHELSIPVLDVNKGLIQKGLVDENPMLLKTGMWGIGTLRYVPPDGEEVMKGQIWMVDFKPFQTPGVDLDYYKECRKYFSLEEWIDLLVSSCQFNPEIHTLPQKMLLLSRIIPLVQPRVNQAELAPKGTGKSFVFDNISRYAAVIPGGKLSAPTLFYNSATKQLGLIPRYDVVVVDEVQKIHTDSAGEAMAALKMYLESGRYRRATGDMGTAEAGFIILGNITIGPDRRPLYETNGIFKELPSSLQESAFVDRIHGLLEGWFMPRITKHTPSKSIGFKGDFFSEVLHELRSDLRFSDYVSHSMRLPECDDMRDNKAIARLAEGFLKLLFPDLEVSEEEFIEFCVNPAVRMRQNIRDELAKLDQEYRWVTIKSELPDEFQLSHPDRKPEPEEEDEVDPLSPNRKPVETTIEIADGQKGISYAKLFSPYLTGAKQIKLVDPYIRYDYQIHNLMNFCECVVPTQGSLRLTLITGADSGEQERILSAKFDELKSSLEQDHIFFDYSFEKGIHDRWIETDTGWRIILGRGLDIFQKPKGKFTLGFVDQTRRQCKATTITYTRVKSVT